VNAEEYLSTYHHQQALELFEVLAQPHFAEEFIHTIEDMKSYNNATLTEMKYEENLYVMDRSDPGSMRLSTEQLNISDRVENGPLQEALERYATVGNYFDLRGTLVQMLANANGDDYYETHHTHHTNFTTAIAGAVNSKQVGNLSSIDAINLLDHHQQRNNELYDAFVRDFKSTYIQQLQEEGGELYTRWEEAAAAKIAAAAEIAAREAEEGHRQTELEHLKLRWNQERSFDDTFGDDTFGALDDAFGENDAALSIPYNHLPVRGHRAHASTILPDPTPAPAQPIAAVSSTDVLALAMSMSMSTPADQESVVGEMSPTQLQDTKLMIDALQDLAPSSLQNHTPFSLQDLAPSSLQDLAPSSTAGEDDNEGGRGDGDGDGDDDVDDGDGGDAAVERVPSYEEEMIAAAAAFLPLNSEPHSSTVVQVAVVDVTNTTSASGENSVTNFGAGQDAGVDAGASAAEIAVAAWDLERDRMVVETEAQDADVGSAPAVDKSGVTSAVAILVSVLFALVALVQIIRSRRTNYTLDIRQQHEAGNRQAGCVEILSPISTPKPDLL
jgi:hypothetical protein